MANNQDNNEIETELQCKLHCLSMLTADVVRQLIAYIVQESEFCDLSTMLQYHEKDVKKLNSTNYGDNKKKLYGNDDTIKSDVNTKEFDLTFLCDLLQNVPPFPFGKPPYKSQKKKAYHTLEGCVTEEVCCAVCLNCVKCNNNCIFFELKKPVKDLKELRNKWAHPASSIYKVLEEKLKISPIDKECVEWNEKLENWKKDFKAILKFLKSKLHISEDYHDKMLGLLVTIITEPKEKYFPFFQKNEEMVVYRPKHRTKRTLEVRFDCGSKHFRKLKDVSDMNSPQSNKLQSTLNSKFAELVNRLLESDDVNAIETRMGRITFEESITPSWFCWSKMKRKCVYSVIIRSRKDQIPDCYESVESPKSQELRKSVTKIFKDQLCIVVDLNPDEVDIICHGWRFESIRIYFKIFLSEKILAHQPDLCIKAALTDIIQMSSVTEVLRAHDLKDCDINIDFENDDHNDKDILTVGFNIAIFDEEVANNYDHILPDLQDKYKDIIAMELVAGSTYGNEHTEVSRSATSERKKPRSPKRCSSFEGRATLDRILKKEQPECVYNTPSLR